MSTSVRTLEIRVNQTGDGATGIRGITQGLGGVGTIAAGAATAGLAVATGAVIALGAGLASSIGEAMEAQDVQAELAAVIESTGGKAGMTAEAVNKLASDFQGLTRFGDEAIVSGESMLLTFTNIGADVFPMATEAMLNMGQKFGSVDQAAVQLGKALNDPIAGVGALRRVGVQLTEAQELQIQKFMEVGDIASAQKVILGELEVEFGGLAVAAGQTFGGQMDRLKNTFGEVQETIGAAFLPVLQQLAELFLAALNSPTFQAALATVAGFITETVVPAISKLVGWIRDQVIPRFREFFAELKERVGPVLAELQGHIQRISEKFGTAGQKVSLLDALFKALDITLKVAVPIIEGIMRTINGLARAVEWVINAVRSAIRAWNDFKEAVEAVAAAIAATPLMPGSPTPMEIGLRGIARAAGEAAGSMGGMLPGGLGGMSVAGGGMGGGAIVVNLTYSPAISLADRYEAEQRLAPLIAAAIRREMELR